MSLSFKNKTSLLCFTVYTEFCDFKDRYTHGMGVISENTAHRSVSVSLLALPHWYRYQYWNRWISSAFYLVSKVSVKTGIGTLLVLIMQIVPYIRNHAYYAGIMISFSLLNCSLECSFKLEFEPIKRHTRWSSALGE